MGGSIGGIVKVVVGVVTGNWLMVAQAGFSLLSGSLFGGKQKPKGRGGAFSFSSQVQQQKTMVRSSTEAHRIVYGRAKVSGPLVAAFVTSSNAYAHWFVPMAGHEIDGFEEVYLDDKLSTDSDIASLTRINTHLGADDQAAD